MSCVPTLSILDLPPEVLDYIFEYLKLNLTGLLELALVCRQFRHAAYRQPIPVTIPLQDEVLRVIVHNKIPVNMLCNREPALFVKYQIGQLNLRRLVSAQLVANDYLAKSNKVLLSPFYIEILDHLTKFSSNSLRSLMLNVDLQLSEEENCTNCSSIGKTDDVRYLPNGSKNDCEPQSNSNSSKLHIHYRCADFICCFKNLTYLAMHFTPQIELQQRILGTNHAQNLISQITASLIRLKTMYVFACPIQNLKISSNSLEKLCIYKSEFVDIKEMKTPKLKSLMFHNGLAEFFRTAREDRERGVRYLHGGLFRVIYNGCPQLDFFNSVYVGILRKHNLSQKEWSHYAMKLCVRKYQYDKDFAAEYSSRA